MLEGDFSKEIVNGIKSWGGWARKWPNRSMGSTQPFDISACVDGRFVAIESKMEKTEHQVVAYTIVVRQTDLTRGQHTNLEEITNAGGFGLVAACIVQGRTKKAYLIPYSLFVCKDEWRVKDLPPFVENVREYAEIGLYSKHYPVELWWDTKTKSWRTPAQDSLTQAFRHWEPCTVPKGVGTARPEKPR